MNNEIKFTENGKSYWDGSGAYQEEYNTLYDEMVPASGHAETKVGEVLRAVSRLGYEYYNNGNCNACETEEIEGEWHECETCNGNGEIEDEDGEMITCPDCCGDGGYSDESEYEYSISEFYEQFLLLLEEVFGECECAEGEKAVGKVREIIVDSCFSKENERAYARMTDCAMAWIIENKDSKEPIPGWYKN